MGWLWAIIVGLVLGLIAKAIIPGKQHLPLWLTVILGMIGGIAGNAIARAAGVEATSGIDWWRHIFQLVMAIILVGLGDRAWTAARRDSGRAKA
ncbi:MULTISPECIES: GlsB/YeaQ/YmgE family stress response membrane protein [Streptomyces]|uniref:GlsB/YeaQ/YmgE family stress response membrane protein n=1 Tax=Streptomyces TaxID=1883 RepID=UPI0004C7CA6D|nr:MULTISPECIES: GlsB/YeaQ/YmgE family stress response membrane protein [Streptomyces]MCX3290906.1 GlsB/YeaQ/YmgE family stress response membrane protein [Streptomyces sp. NEAU-H22]WMD07885.1 GlsB/YeaQ/YmgE family stress response membrane protein [Streptomyces sp. FXY-T5]GGV70629.1 signal peptidase [Streptomyces massasporeus]